MNKIITIPKGQKLDAEITINIPERYPPPFGGSRIIRNIRVQHDNNFNIIVEIEDGPIVIGDLTLYSMEY